MKLNILFTDLPKKKKAKLLGRGIGCGKGKTSGRGHKGQKARSGVSINGFEGGQQSIFTRLPKRGFKSKFKQRYAVVNIGDIEHLISADKISDNYIDKNILFSLGLIRSLRCKVKLLNNCELKSKLIFDVDAVSRSAQASIESAGGKVEL
ncbi:MAG: 50S ribosomal protein L15 [Candidatus Mesenet longicola]|uniref:Large ribosomal subunit protein uL15 n=1 Tax=Candidatus Mesenet longicola TaxID=1892558 RepID=A0A8J3HRX0_9RICK|nr:MAG: 50S ribosomal protein L15 [Candidatus Mesenet longicola]GHM59168.1 MAG: 50S ribosomal protein L15 [Candidatus Mesenet longicola]